MYRAERDLLRSHGHEVMEFTRNSDEIRSRGFFGTLKGAFTTPWNPFAARKLRRKLKDVQPEIMHVHNTFPLLSPAVFSAAKGMKTATVYTLHNYRTFCASGIPMRNSTSCTECLDRFSVIPSLKYGCYRSSRPATVPLAVGIAFHRKIKTWERDVDAFIPLTKFQRDKLSNAGLPKQKMHIKPHFYPASFGPLPWENHKPMIVFTGRLGPEKGLHLLVETWRKWGDQAPSLELIGDGPERKKLQARVDELNLGRKIRFHGQLSFTLTQKKLARARLLILPSLSFEGFPMAVCEAFALGVPVAASRHGAFPYLIEHSQNGVLFEPGNVKDILQVLRKLWNQPEKLAEMGRKARADFEKKYSAEVNYKRLIDIYQAAIETHQDRTG